MRTVCEENQCAGCGVCIEVCHKQAIQLMDSMEAYNAVLDQEHCVECGACKRVCPQINRVMKSKPNVWYQGWAEDEQIRRKSSSGGAARALSESVIHQEGIVYSCTFTKGEFVFSAVDKIDELDKFTGSKYVKSNPSGIYHKIKKDVQNGRIVLFIGLPCQAAAVRNYVGDHEKLYTVDLICHGTPSPQILNNFLRQFGDSLEKITNIEFRYSDRFNLFKEKKSYVPNGVRDGYTKAFLDSICYTANCYSCQFACIERCSDITIGDSWGSELSDAEKKQGISLILCQTDKGVHLVNSSDLVLKPVDLKKAISSNSQLQNPAKMPAARGAFFDMLKRGYHFDRAIFRIDPQFVIKQRIKALLIQNRIMTYREGG